MFEVEVDAVLKHIFGISELQFLVVYRLTYTPTDTSAESFRQIYYIGSTF